MPNREDDFSGVSLFFYASFLEWPLVKSLSHVRLFAIPWTVVYQASLSMGFSRQEYWSRLSFPSPGDLPDPGIDPRSPALQADALPSEPPGNTTRMALELMNWKISWRKEWLPTPVFFPGESHDRGAWRATVQGVAKSRTRLSN